MRVETTFVDLPATGYTMRAALATPIGLERAPGLIFYSDIFQLTASTLRMITRFAGYGFAVLAPEIFCRREPPGSAWAFDDPGRDRGMANAKAISVAQFDADTALALAFLQNHAAVESSALGAVGFCFGGHLAFRAAFHRQVQSTVCYYPTGLHNGALGSDADAGSLARASEIHGALHLIFGTEDPHVPTEAREQIVTVLTPQIKDFRVTTYPAAHAFMRDEGPRYDPESSDNAFTEGLASLRCTGGSAG